MSLLSTFAILFETDAKKATDDVDGLSGALEGVGGSAASVVKSFGDTEASTSDLIAQMKSLGFSNSEIADSLTSLGASYVESINAVQAFDQELRRQREDADSGAVSIGGLTKIMLGLGAAYVGFSAVANGVIENALAIDTVGKFSQTLGLNIVEVDAWGEAIVRNGGSAEAFRGTVASLQGSLQDIKIDGGGEMINTLAMLGIQATDSGGQIKSAFDVLPEIARSFENMSSAESFAFGEKLGLDQGTILTLQQGRAEVDKLVERQKMLGGVTQEGYEDAAKFNDQWADTKRVFNSLWMSANNSILPMLTAVFEGLEKVVLWVRENQTLVEGFFIGVGGVIAAVYLPAIASAAAATIVAAAPFILIGAAIAAVGVAISVLYEDIMAWVNGSESAIGRVLGSFEDFKAKIFSVFDAIGKKWDDFVGVFEDSAKYISDLLDFSADADIGIEQSDSTSIANGSYSRSGTEAAQDIIASYSATNLNHGGSTVNQRTQQNNVTIGGATVDARGMSSGQARSVISASMKDSFESAIGQLADGVQR
ncbi:hypothetical protein MAELSTROM_40 [Pseudoalteromonas phage Maelstrom]|uniref:tail fiber protein/ lysozyme n=1 Tax=Pseudoalteromonas phage Maelstrom TaxID=2065202 RepID=UPI000CA1238C|nr:tail fiber protein/ lysozyme [Pseudoalteromonas phage Maelstrom]AUG84959.1 hypothetical protein MAELSTROM_40 [Pseudoalteromonas phage Maelstrom]